jgi:hypothetical protein
VVVVDVVVVGGVVFGVVLVDVVIVVDVMVGLVEPPPHPQHINAAEKSLSSNNPQVGAESLRSSSSSGSGSGSGSLRR